MAIFTKVEETTILGSTVNRIFSNIMSYDIGRDDCVMRYELRYVDPNRESVAIPDTVITSNMWKVPKDVINSWSGSNAYLVEELCKTIGLTPIEHAADSDRV